MRSSIRKSFAFFFLFALALVSGCGIDQTGTAPPPHSLGGHVTGLSGKLTLFAAGMAATVTLDGSFAFSRLLADGERYDVIVLEAPADQRCSVENGSGVMAGANVTNVDVTCGKGLFSVGGAVSGLSGELTLQNGSSYVKLTADGPFSFPTLVADGAEYAVKVYEQPADQACVVAKGGGVIAGADVTDVIVSCGADDPRLANLELSTGVLSPMFSPDTNLYWSDLGLLAQSVALRPTAIQPDATITVNGVPVASGSLSPVFPLDLGANFINVHVAVPSGATRDYAVLVGREEGLAAHYLKASNTGANDGFGYSVAFDGDTLAVGAPGEDSNATGIDGNQSDGSASSSGAVYVFRRNGETFVQEAYVKASNTASNDIFGMSVALSGDTLVIGAPGEDSDAIGVGGSQSNDNASASGAVYVFVRTAGKWAQQAYIKASNGDANDYFGTSVALSGDTLAVGAIGEDSNATGIAGNQDNESKTDSGAAYVFVRVAGVWAQQAYIKASNTDANDSFGVTLALSGDTLVVGADAEDSNAVGVNGNADNDSDNDSGAAYVFVRAAGVWAQEAYLKASNTATNDHFGASLALFGDTLAVGAYGEDSSAVGVNGDQGNDDAADSGAVYVFSRNGAAWAQSAYVKASNTENFDYFGASVALSEGMLVVGADGENGGTVGLDGKQGDNTANDSGAVYLFARGGGSFSQVGYLKPPNTDASDAFGGSVALYGDTLVCASVNEDSDAIGIDGNPYDNTAAESGAVYVFH